MPTRRYKLAVTRLSPEYHTLVKQIASPKVGTFNGIDSMIKTALLFLIEDLAQDAKFQEAYGDIYNQELVAPGDSILTD